MTYFKFVGGGVRPLQDIRRKEASVRFTVASKTSERRSEA